MVKKALLTQRVAKSTALSLRDASACIDIILDTLTDAISKGERIELRGFGTFSTRQMAEKRYPSSLSGQTVVIPSRKKIVFRPSQNLKLAVWNRASSPPVD